MPDYVPVIVFVALLFGAMILRLATSRGFSNKLTGWLVVIAAFGGFVFYGYAYAQHESDPFLAVIRALLSVCDMFTGSVDENAIDYAKLSSNPPSLILFWLIHLMAFYATASATIAVLGAEVLRKLRVWFSRWGDLCIIYGASAESIDFGLQLAKQKKRSWFHAVVYVDSTPDEGTSTGIVKNEFILRSDGDALRASKKFAKSVGIRKGKRKITLYAINKDGEKNIAYAQALLHTLRDLKVAPNQTDLLLWGCHEYVSAELRGSIDKYGYGTVSSVTDSDLVSRVLIQKYPPCNTIRFDESGMALEKFHALVIGFGHIGQKITQQLITNGQFHGSSFRCDIFDPNISTTIEFLPKPMLENYNICFYESEWSRKELHSYLAQNLHTLKYIVISTGDDLKNKEIAAEIAFYCLKKKENIPIYQCSRERIILTAPKPGNDPSQVQEHISYTSWYDADDLDPGTLYTEKTELFDPNYIHFGYADALAMQINKFYYGSDQSAQQLWMDCPHFSRNSCRSAADYMMALFHAVGIAYNRELITESPPSGQLLQNLAICEHMRWCAFHFCHGYSTMTKEEFLQRAELYRQNQRIRVAKNTENHTHACLIPWHELNELSTMEQKYTGRCVDYASYDVDNVRAVWYAMKNIQDKFSQK